MQKYIWVQGNGVERWILHPTDSPIWHQCRANLSWTNLLRILPLQLSLLNNCPVKEGFNGRAPQNKCCFSHLHENVGRIFEKWSKMGSPEKVSLRWNDFQADVASDFKKLRGSEDFTDVTLVCSDGQKFSTHKVILASSSLFFKDLLTTVNHSHPLHYGIRAMGAMTLRISDLCLSFSPHPNISDGNFNLVHHFFACKYFR